MHEEKGRIEMNMMQFTSISDTILVRIAVYLNDTIYISDLTDINRDQLIHFNME